MFFRIMTAISFPLRRKDFFRPVHLRLSAMIKPLLRRRAVSLLQPDLHIIRDIFQRSGILCGVCPVKVLQRLVPIDFRTETLGIADSQMVPAGRLFHFSPFFIPAERFRHIRKDFISHKVHRSDFIRRKTWPRANACLYISTAAALSSVTPAP